MEEGGPGCARAGPVASDPPRGERRGVFSWKAWRSKVAPTSVGSCCAPSSSPRGDAILRAGIRRCVVAIQDPHEIVNGRGLRRLEGAGVAVEVGLCAEEVRQQLGGYVLAHTERRPRVTWKVAMTLDARIADWRRCSRWITGEAARADAHRLRAGADAVMVGSGTARADDPRLTARIGRRVSQPLRVVCDT